MTVRQLSVAVQTARVLPVYELIQIQWHNYVYETPLGMTSDMIPLYVTRSSFFIGK